MHQTRFRLGSVPHPAWGDHSAPPDPLFGLHPGPGLYPGPGVYPGPGYYPGIYGMYEFQCLNEEMFTRTAYTFRKLQFAGLACTEMNSSRQV